ncbi:hypothetical protein BH09ACT9_BH09ACT9_08010 [soil metagenome]
MPFLGSTIHRPVCMLMTATVVAASIALMSPRIASAQSNGCSKTFNLFIPGTWETAEDADPSIPVGLLKPIAHSITDRPTEPYIWPSSAVFDSTRKPRFTWSRRSAKAIRSWKRSGA